MGLDSRKIIVLSLFLMIFSLIIISSVNAYCIEENDGISTVISMSNDSIDDSSSILEDDLNSIEYNYNDNEDSNQSNPDVNYLFDYNDNYNDNYSDSSNSNDILDVYTENKLSNSNIGEICSLKTSKNKLYDSEHDSGDDSEPDDDSVTIEDKSALDQFLEDIENYSGGTIYINGNIVINKTIILSKSMTIDGKNHTISSNNNCRIFLIKSDVVLKNIIFKNSFSTNGGAIYSNAKLSLTNCQFLSNNASSNGGAIYSLGNLNINNCKFTKNNAGANGGAVFCSGELVIKNSNFTNNNAVKSGGAVFIKNKLTLTNSYFGQNKASIAGGAIDISIGMATIKNSKFEKNSVTSQSSKVLGGAIFASSDTKITSSVFNNNFCRYTKKPNLTYQSSGGALAFSNGSHTVSSSSFNSNYVDNDGGAIFAGKEANKLIVEKSNFTKNKANFEDGGAISSAAKNTQVKNSKFISNFANEDGGAIDTYSLTGQKVTVKVSNCEFKSNKAYKAAGAVYLGVKTERVIENSKFYSNKATVGGCMYIESGTTKINKCVFEGNSASKLTGSVVYNKNNQKILNAGGAIFNNCSSLTVLSSRFSSNKAYCGGVIYNKGKFILKNSKLNSNSASLGGAIVSSIKAVKIYSSSFSSNKASSLGGAIYLNTGSMNLYSSTFKSNKASSLGGALYQYSGTLNLYSSTLKSNNACTSGGALYKRAGKFYSKKNYYSYNVANANGGALLIHSGKINLLSNSFKSNKAKKQGGAIYIKSAKGKIRSNALISNKAKKFKEVYSEKSISLANNWWGKINKSPKKLNITNLKVKSWLVLKIKSSKSKLSKGKSSKIRLNLRYNNKNKRISNIPNLKAVFSSNGGTFNIKSKKLKNGLAVVKFTKKSSKKVKVYGKVLGVRVSVNIK